MSSRQVAFTRDGTTTRTLRTACPLTCDVAQRCGPVVVLRVATPEFDLLVGRPSELCTQLLINHESSCFGVGGGNVVDTGDHSLAVAYAASRCVFRRSAVHGTGPPHVTRINRTTPLDFLVRTASNGAKGLINELISELGVELFKGLRGFSWHGVRLLFRWCLYGSVYHRWVIHSVVLD